jgi:hypothetical protein
VTITRILCFLVVCNLVLCVSARGQEGWNRIESIEDVVGLYPDRVSVLLQSIDFNSKGLESVKAAVEKNRRITACKELLKYYREGRSAPFLRREQPVSSRARHSEADSIVDHVFTFYDLPDKVPQRLNGPIDWSYQGPAKDIEWAWALNRHYHMRVLLDAYFQTGNSIYAETLDLHLQDWVISSLPYPGKKSSTTMWRGLEVSFRVKIWAAVFFGLINSDFLSPATQLLILSSLPEHTHYLQHFHAREGNWLTMEMSGLAMVATAWKEFEKSSQWIAYAKNRMIEGLHDQIYPDGVQKELTSMYHQVALSNLKQFEEICRQANEPLPEEYKQRLEDMHNYISYSVSPSGYGLLNNDSDKRYNREEILQAAKVYDRDDWQFIASNGREGIRPAGPPSVLFPWAGQLISRSDYDSGSQFSFFDIGPWGTGHQHSDKLHLSVSAYGRDFLVDGGRFAYRGKLADKFRKYATGSLSHNVILLDGVGQGPGPLSAKEPLSTVHYRITDEFDYAWNSFHRFPGLEGAAKHTRALFYLRGKFWIVVDRVETDRRRKVETLWHWHPDATVLLERNGMATTNHEKGNLRILPIGYEDWDVQLVKGREEPVPQGWYSERYNSAEPNAVSIYSTEINETSYFAWLIYPTREKVSAVEAKILRDQSDMVTVLVKDDEGKTWEISVPFSNSKNPRYTFRSAKGRKGEADR